VDDNFLTALGATGDLRREVESRPIGQPRTSPNKQFVILGKTVVWKGPYKGKSMAKVKNLKERVEWLTKWNTPLLLLPIRFVGTPVGTFIEYQNLVDMSTLKTRENVESFTGWRYQVVEREGLNKLNEVLPLDWIYSTYGEDLVTALTHLWILKTGDTGLSNILADLANRKVYVIDFEEIRGSDRDDEMFYFSRRCAAKYKWSENVTPYYGRVAEKLRPLLSLWSDSSSVLFMDRIRLAIERLEKYATSSSTISVQPIKVKTVISPAFTFTPKKTAPVFSLKKMTFTFGQAADSSSTASSSKIPTIISPTAPTSSKIGRMEKKFRNDITYSGYRMDEMISAVQKYIRRGKEVKALQSATEVWRMVEVDAVNLQSNLYNRVATIAVEDVGPAAIDLVIYTVNYIVEITKKKKIRELAPLCAIVQQLCKVPKTRIMSQIWRAYGTEEGRRYAANQGIPVEEPMIEVTGLEKFFREDDPVELIGPAKMFYLRLSERSTIAVYWLAVFTERIKVEGKKDKKAERTLKSKRDRRSKASIIIWEMLRDFLPSSTVDVLIKGYYDCSEPRAFMMCPVTWVLFTPPGQVPVLNDVSSQMELSIDKWQRSPYLNTLREGKYTLELDDYVIDVHTKRGRDMGKSRREFVTEGAHVENESELFRMPLFEDVYLNS